MRHIAMALGIALALAGCGKSDKSDDNKDESAKKQPQNKADKTPAKQPGSDGADKKAPPKPDAKKSAASTAIDVSNPPKISEADWAKLVGDENKTDYKKVEVKDIPTTGVPAKTMGGGLDKHVQQIGFRASYSPGKGKVHETLRTAFENEKVFEKMATVLNTILKIPRLIDIQMTSCGQPNAFYDPNKVRVILCYELVVEFIKLFKTHKDYKTKQQVAIGAVMATIFTFFHEAGHALRDQLKLPITGKEEDAVDELATLLLLEMPQGVYVAAAAAEAFQLMGKKKRSKKGEKLAFWDDHSLGEQRFYNVLCLMYGANPKANKGLVDKGYLPRQRAQFCPEDYKNKSQAWQTILKPHFTELVLKSIAKKKGGTVEPKVPMVSKTPAVAPAQPTLPAVKVPAGVGPECQKAVPHMLGMLRTLLVQQAPANVAKFDAKLPAELPKIYKICQSQWKPAQIKCVLAAKTALSANTCFQKK